MDELLSFDSLFDFYCLFYRFSIYFTIYLLLLVTKVTKICEQKITRTIYYLPFSVNEFIVLDCNKINQKFVYQKFYSILKIKFK